MGSEKSGLLFLLGFSDQGISDWEIGKALSRGLGNWWRLKRHTVTWKIKKISHPIEDNLFFLEIQKDKFKIQYYFLLRNF